MVKTVVSEDDGLLGDVRRVWDRLLVGSGCLWLEPCVVGEGRCCSGLSRLVLGGSLVC